MRVVALISGGKDSCYSMYLCKQHGHEVVALANLLPEESAPDELDSFCFQTVGHQLVGAYAACMGLPLFRKHISGTSAMQDLGYAPTEGDEVEDLYQLLSYVKDTIPGVQAVATGAIASDYQRLRVENVCSRLNLVSLAYLWHQPQRMLLRGMVESGVEAILVKVACLGLSPRKHLGRSIAALEPQLLALADAYGCNVCGEGGEYETLTLDCPVFGRGRIALDEYDVVTGSGDVGHLVPRSFRVLPKPGWGGGELPADVRVVPRDYVPPPRGSGGGAGGGGAGGGGRAGHHPQSPTPYHAPATPPHAPATPPQAASAAASSSPVPAAAVAAAAAAAAAAVDPLLQPLAPPSFGVQVCAISGPDYVQLVCRAVRQRSALAAAEVTEGDTTAALSALLSAAQQELALLHMDLRHCLFVHLFLAHMGHFQAANGVYCKHFSGRDPPSRACVQVSLPPDVPVVCDFLLARGSAPPPPSWAAAVAAAAAAGVPAPAPPQRHTRRVLHVQSISSWAPSCIGPYSQATSYRGLVFMAGVIPLDPPAMTLIPGDITAQVLRAMASCEAVAIAQRTTILGAALGLTVYLAATTSGGGGGGAATGGGGGGGGGMGAAVVGSPPERGSGGGAVGGGGGGGGGSGAEHRALARSAVEALLENGLPGYPQQHGRHSATNFGGGGLGGGGSHLSSSISASRFSRSSTTDLAAGGAATPRSGHAASASAAASAAAVAALNSGSGAGSTPGSRRAMVLGADAPDEEAEEAAAAAAAAAEAEEGVGGFGGGGGGGSGRSRRSTATGLGGGAATVLDPYLQPPEVRCAVRPSVLYVTVPSLPRGSLVEVQPVCLDVEALAVIRRLAGHDGVAKRRSSSHADAASMHAAGGAAGGPPSAGARWGDLPPTPRGSLESLATNSSSGGAVGGGGAGVPAAAATAAAAAATHGSAPLSWQTSSDFLQVPPHLPSHLIHAAGFTSPEAGSLVGTPSSAVAAGMLASTLAGAGASSGSSHGRLARQRCSGLGLLPNGGGSGYFRRSSSSLTGGEGGGGGGGTHASLPLAPPHSQPPLSPVQLARQQQPPHAAEDVGGGGGHAPPVPIPRPRVSASGGGGGAAAVSVPGSVAGSATTGGGGGGVGGGGGAAHAWHGSFHPGSSAPPLRRSSLDGNILSFEVSCGHAPRGAHTLTGATGGGGGSVAAAAGGLQQLPGLGHPHGPVHGQGGSSAHHTQQQHHHHPHHHSPQHHDVGPRSGDDQAARPQHSSKSPHHTAASGRTSPFPLDSHAAAAAAAAAVPTEGPATLHSAGGGFVRPRPAAIAIPPGLAAVGATVPPNPSPFEGAFGLAVEAQAAAAAATAAAAAAAAKDGDSGGDRRRHTVGALGAYAPSAAAVPPLRVPPVATSPPTPLLSAPAGVGAPPAAPPAAPGGSASDVMVTTVCCYGQVLRSLFHLPPAVFAPGVTTAQLTRRFRRAAASVLAAHGMDMSCLIWVRLWYDKGAVTLSDDEYSGYSLAACGGGGAVGGPAGGGAAPQSGATTILVAGGRSVKVQHAREDEEERGGSSGNDSSGGGTRGSGGSNRTGGRADIGGGAGGGGGGGSNAAAAAAGGAGLVPPVSPLTACADVAWAATSPLPSGMHSPLPGRLAAQACSPLPGGASGGSGVPEAAAHGGGAAQAEPQGHSMLHRQQQQQPHVPSQQGQPHPSHLNAHANHAQHGPHQHHHSHHSHHHHHHHHSHHHAHAHLHFHVSWVPVQSVATNASPQPGNCVAVLELLAALPTP